MKPALLCAALLAAACATPPPVTMSAREAGTCGELYGWEAVATAARGKALLFGESHGTNEMPEAFFRYVCHVARRRDPILIGLEMDPDEDALLQRGFEADDSAEVWKGLDVFYRFDDGRGSLAVMRLLQDLKALRAEGRGVEVRAVAGRAWNNLDERVAALPHVQSRRFGGDAANLLAVSEGYEHVVYYAGNLHARNAGRQVDGDGPLFDQRAFVRLCLAHDGGAAWNNTDHHVGVNEDEPMAFTADLGPAPSVGLGDVHADEWYAPCDGYFYVGTITRSFPAVSTSS